MLTSEWNLFLFFLLLLYSFSWFISIWLLSLLLTKESRLLQFLKFSFFLLFTSTFEFELLLMLLFKLVQRIGWFKSLILLKFKSFKLKISKFEWCRLWNLLLLMLEFLDVLWTGCENSNTGGFAKSISFLTLYNWEQEFFVVLNPLSWNLFLC